MQALLGRRPARGRHAGFACHAVLLLFSLITTLLNFGPIRAILKDPPALIYNSRILGRSDLTYEILSVPCFCYPGTLLFVWPLATPVGIRLGSVVGAGLLFYVVMLGGADRSPAAVLSVVVAPLTASSYVVAA